MSIITLHARNYLNRMSNTPLFYAPYSTGSAAITEGDYVRVHTGIATADNYKGFIVKESYTPATLIYDRTTTWMRSVQVSPGKSFILRTQTQAGSTGIYASILYHNSAGKIIGSTIPTLLSTSTVSIYKPVLLDSTRVFVTYMEGNKVMVAVVTINSDDTLSVGNVITLDTIESTAHVGVIDGAVLVDTNKVLVVFRPSTSGWHLAQVCGISGTTITKGAAVGLADGSTTSNLSAVCKINTNKAVLAYIRTDNGRYMNVITVSGLTPSWHTSTLYEGGSARMSLIQASADKGFFTCAFPDAVYVYGFTVSGTTVNGASNKGIATSITGTDDIQTCLNDNTHFTTAWTQDNSKIRCTRVTFDATTLAMTTPTVYTVDSAGVYGYAGIDAISSTQTLLTYVHNGGDNLPFAQLVDNGNKIDKQSVGVVLGGFRSGYYPVSLLANNT